MKNFFTIILILLPFLIFSQEIKYETIKLNNIDLEYFPINYKIKPFKIFTEKNKYTGVVTLYQELNESGISEGLTLIFQNNDPALPASAYYYRNGVMVYKVDFFSKSKKAFLIANRNLDNILEGPQIIRKINFSNKIEEVIENYNNGKMINSNQEKYNPVFSFNNYGYLDGYFSFKNDNRYLKYEGEANNGSLVFLKETYMEKDIYETRIKDDSMILTGMKGVMKDKRESYKINSNLKITNDKLKYNQDGYFYVENIYEIPDVIKNMKYFPLPPFIDTITFVDSLLDGYFSFRSINDEYQFHNSGIASKGRILKYNTCKYTFNVDNGESVKRTSTEYINLNVDSIEVYNINISDESIKTKEDTYFIKLKQYVTNSDKLIFSQKEYFSIWDLNATFFYNMRFDK